MHCDFGSVFEIPHLQRDCLQHYVAHNFTRITLLRSLCPHQHADAHGATARAHDAICQSSVFCVSFSRRYTVLRRAMSHGQIFSGFALSVSLQCKAPLVWSHGQCRNSRRHSCKLCEPQAAAATRCRTGCPCLQRCLLVVPDLRSRWLVAALLHSALRTAPYHSFRKSVRILMQACAYCGVALPWLMMLCIAVFCQQ